MRRSMVVRDRRNFILVRFASLCYVFVILVGNLCVSSQQANSAVEGVKHTSSVAGGGIDLNVDSLRHVGNLHQAAKVLPNVNDASTLGKPLPLAAAASVANFEDRSGSNNSKKNSLRKTQSLSGDRNDSIVFPPTANGVSTRTAFFDVNELVPDAKEIENCKLNAIAGTSLCNVTQKYPTSFVKSLLASRKELVADLFGNDSLSPVLGANLIGTRFQEDQGFKTLCQSREFLSYPRLGKTEANEWKYILQEDGENQRLVQGIRVEVCVKDNQECDLVQYFPNGYSFQCMQKFIYRRLYTISADDKAIVKESFEFPSCCVCVYKEAALDSRSIFNQSPAISKLTPRKPPSKPAPSKPAPSKPSPPRG